MARKTEDPRGRKRSARVEILLLEEEKEILTELAKKEGHRTLSSFARTLLLKELHK